MSLGFGFGDIVAIGKLLTTTVRKCQAASKDFQELSHILQTVSLCVESARATLESIYNQLPAVHQTAVASAFTGLRNLSRELNSELDRYATITPGQFQLVKLQFALLSDPRSTESKLTLYLSMLNTSMAIIICDSMTRSNMQPYKITNLVGGGVNHQTTSQVKHSVAEQWIATASSGSMPGEPIPRPFAARGIFTYNTTVDPALGLPHTDRVDYKFHISSNHLYGTSKDSVGSATIDGQINLQRNTIRFVKQYLAPKEHIRWEYDGYFVSCGIVGEWHYPGDPPTKKHHRGRFAVWLRSDEAVQGGDLEEQLKLLESKGGVLTRSLTFRSS